MKRKIKPKRGVRARKSRDVKIVESDVPGAEPIILGRDPSRASVRGRLVPVPRLAVLRAYLEDEVLKRLSISVKRFDDGASLTEKERKSIFLGMYEAFGNRNAACKFAGITRAIMRGWRMDDKEFCADMDDAYESCVDDLELEAWRRASRGHEWETTTETEGPDGVSTKTVRGAEVSDSLLMFLLKGQRREVYGNKTELTGANGGPLAIGRVERVFVDPNRDAIEKSLNDAEAKL